LNGKNITLFVSQLSVVATLLCIWNTALANQNPYTVGEIYESDNDAKHDWKLFLIKGKGKGKGKGKVKGKGKGKGKAVSLQAWSGPEGSRKLRFPDYMKTAQDGGKIVNLTHRPPLPPRNNPCTHFC
jgi:hypothetical protein